MSGPENSPPPLRRPGGHPPPELQQALGELESAVRKLAGTAQREISDRAADVLNETAGRLRRTERRALRRAERYQRRRGGLGSYGGRSDDSAAQGDGDDSAQGGGANYGRRRRRRTYRVPHEGVIAGVCAGLARRLGLETWVVRCFAMSGLVFMPQIVFPGYWVMCLVMRRATPEEADAAYGVSRGSRGHAPIAGFDRGASVRDRLRSTRSTFEAVELRLRRMEGYVTSSRYELDREMTKIDG